MGAVVVTPREQWPEDWPSRLAAHIAEGGARGHEWGVNDCALFTCNWIKAIAGYDPAAAFRGRYRSQRGSLRALLEHGAGTLIPTFEALMPPRISVFSARRGDAVAAMTQDGPALGLIADHRAVFIALRGTVLLQRAACLAAWPVG